MILLQIVTFIISVIFCSSKYEYVCPTSLGWRIRGKALCNSTLKYSCLNDENKHTSIEICRVMPSVLAAGNKHVIRGNLDAKDCNGNRYQPFIFRTNESTDCAIKKSNCNGVGQTIYNNGSTTDDKSCRCDYSKSYAPINRPSNPCYCVPSVEDCSCYQKHCPDKTILSPEYTCESIYSLSKPDKCGPITLSGPSQPKNTRDSGYLDTKKNRVKRDELLLLVARIVASTSLVLAISLTVSGIYIIFYQEQPAHHSETELPIGTEHTTVVTLDEQPVPHSEFITNLEKEPKTAINKKKSKHYLETHFSTDTTPETNLPVDTDPLLIAKRNKSPINSEIELSTEKVSHSDLCHIEGSDITNTDRIKHFTKQKSVNSTKKSNDVSSEKSPTSFSNPKTVKNSKKSPEHCNEYKLASSSDTDTVRLPTADGEPNFYRCNCS